MSPTTVCCGVGAGCETLTEDECTVRGGSYAADDTDCADVPDPCAATGACCGGVLGCGVLTEDDFRDFAELTPDLYFRVLDPATDAELHKTPVHRDVGSGKEFRIELGERGGS